MPLSLAPRVEAINHKRVTSRQLQDIQLLYTKTYGANFQIAHGGQV